MLENRPTPDPRADDPRADDPRADDPRADHTEPTHARAPESTRALGLVLAVVGLTATVTGAASSLGSGGPMENGDPATPGATASTSGVPGAHPGTTEPYDDLRVRAFVQAHGPVIDSIAYGEDDVVFEMGGRKIHFQDGRMLDAERLDQAPTCDPVFYTYPLGPLSEALPVGTRPSYCTHWQEGLFGHTEGEIREHGAAARFLGHRLFVNELLVGPLAAVERDVAAAARSDPAVRRWVDELWITYSFIDREIAGTNTRSQHAWGFAVDFVPRSYDGKAVYWRWSRALDPQGWSRIPLDGRWSPPRRVIEIFEEHGFVWGGKWGYFDTVHFEYRPAILIYNRLVGQ